MSKNLIKQSILTALLLSSSSLMAQTTLLDEVSVVEKNYSFIDSNTTEDTNSYTTNKAVKTSTKLDLTLRETPQSILVFTKQRLEDQNIQSVQDVLSKTAGVTLHKWDERIMPTTRGFSISNYMFNGIPSYQQRANDLDLVIYDRVEIVKGANGLSMGDGNPSMSINFIKKHANSKEFKGNILATAGSWDKYGLVADIQTPLTSSGDIRARFVAKHQEQKSYMDKYKKEVDVFYGVVDMDLTDTTYLSIGASYEDLQRNGVRWGGLPAFYTDGTRATFDRKRTVSGDWTYWDVTTKSYFADLKQYIYNNISLNLSLAKRDFDTNTALAYYSGRFNKATNLATGNPSRYTSQRSETEEDINFYASIPFELGNLDHEIVMGTLYNKHKTKKDRWANKNTTAETVDIFNIQSPWSMAMPWNTGVNQLSNTTRKAYYLAGKFSLMQDLKLIAGARVSSWDYKQQNGVGNRKFEDEVTPYVGLIYDIDNNHSIYTSYTTIFNPTSNKGINNQYLDPAVGKNYEVGIKGEYFNGHLNTALSIFRIEQDGYKNTGVKIPGTTTDAFEKIDGVVSKGFEFSIAGKITDNFNLDFALANFEAKNPNKTKFNTEAARTTANLWAKYSINQYNFGAGLNYKSKQYTGQGATKITQDAFVTADLMASYKFNKNLDFQLNVNNLFDKKYYDRIGVNSMVYGDPRSFNFGMKYSF